MTVIPIRSQASSRGARMLRTALGEEIAGWLEDPAVIEVMLNPDGRLWVDRLGIGLGATEHVMAAADGERIIRLVAHHVGAEVHGGAPRVSAELPEGGERFEGLLPPVVASPSFAIRKPAVAVFTLADYTLAGVIAPWQAEFLAAAVRNRKNILVAGGTSTGKTTLTNALLAEVATSSDRVAALSEQHLRDILYVNAVLLETAAGADWQGPRKNWPHPGDEYADRLAAAFALLAVGSGNRHLAEVVNRNGERLHSIRRRESDIIPGAAALLNEIEASMQASAAARRQAVWSYYRQCAAHAASLIELPSG